MKIYRCDQRFYCTALLKYIPVGALLARYENATRLVLQDAPQSDNYWGILTDGFVYDSPKEVTWFYAIEPPAQTLFSLLDSKDEDQYGNVSGTSDGLPDNSKLKVHAGIPYLFNLDTNRWHSFRASGPVGNVTLEIDQDGVIF